METGTLTASVHAGGGQVVVLPEVVSAMLLLRQQGWGVKRLAREFGVSPNTVQRYVRADGYVPFRPPKRPGVLDGLQEWLEERLRQHGGNAAVVRQDLLAEHGVAVSLRTVERALQGARQAQRAEVRATVRYETPPGQQLQVDFGQCTTTVGGQRMRVQLCVSTLGYSRRTFVTVHGSQRQEAWLTHLERAFEHFGGVPVEVLVDNAKALVERHDIERRRVEFNATFEAFCRHWGVTPRACAPFRARTKGKDERMVQYVKRNGIAGREFESRSVLEAHLVRWMRDTADARVHGTTKESPLVRFVRDEAQALRPLAGRPSFLGCRELTRRVQSDCCVEVDTNAYSVPWRLLGCAVAVRVAEGTVSVVHGGHEVARHRQAVGLRERIVDPRHLEGVVAGARRSADAARLPELLRPLSAYEELAGGAL
jgi:transposase